MKKLLLAFAAAATCSMAIAAETYDFRNTEPTIGTVTLMGSLRIYYPGIPEPNPECMVPAVLSYEGNPLVEIESTSSKVQRFIMQADNCYTLMFTNTPYTMPGHYRVTIPEGFMLFNGGSVVSAAFDEEFFIDEPIVMTANPPAGYVTEMPRVVNITFEGVESIIDNDTKPDLDYNLGAIRFDTPGGHCIPGRTVKGNTMTLTIGSVETGEGEGGEAAQAEDVMTIPGMYQLTICAGNLTFVMPDGTKRDCDDMEIDWLLPNIPYPAADPAPGEVASLEEFRFTLQEPQLFGMWNTAPVLYRMDEYGNYSERVATGKRVEAGVVRNMKTDALSFKLNQKVTAPGEYLLKVNKSSFSIQTAENTLATDEWNACEYVYHYTIMEGETSGVEDVTAGNQAADVYNAAGMVIGRGLDAESVKALPAGLYIINGRKVIK